MAASLYWFSDRKTTSLPFPSRRKLRTSARPPQARFDASSYVADCAGETACMNNEATPSRRQYTTRTSTCVEIHLSMGAPSSACEVPIADAAYIGHQVVELGRTLTPEYLYLPSLSLFGVPTHASLSFGPYAYSTGQERSGVSECHEWHVSVPLRCGGEIWSKLTPPREA